MQKAQPLTKCLRGVKVLKKLGDLHILVFSLELDSRQVQKESVFFALKGTQIDGHFFIEEAILKGAKVIVCQEIPKICQNHLTYIQVKDTLIAMGQMAANFFNNPSQKLKVIGITGTNGKTSIVTCLYEVFKKLGYKVGLISTIHNTIDQKIYLTQHTTPNSIALQQLMAKMLQAGCRYCFMEVSSHALVQKRVEAVHFQGAVFTNITHDHLDYHKTFLKYIYAKKILFDNLSSNAFALINTDDKRSEFMIQNTKAKVYRFALKRYADFKAKIIENTFQGLHLAINNQNFWVRLIGTFNASNLGAIFGILKLLDIQESTFIPVLSTLTGVNGRFNCLYDPVKKNYAIVDYAHTPDALKNSLQTIKDIKRTEQDIVTVLGCGGNRDKEKRPKMANIAYRYSNKVIFTNDNPRHEPPENIIKDMLSGLKIEEQDNCLIIQDRKLAIKTGLALLKTGSIIFIAGKGHEKYQDIKGNKYPFDDKKEIKEAANYSFQNI